MDVDNTEEFRCLSLCSGYGGIELGLKRAIPALRTVAYVERDAYVCANLVAKMEAKQLDAAPVWTDVKTFLAKSFRNKIHIITAGYPCQPFSTSGRRKGPSDSRYIWPDIERVIETVRPVWIFCENVAGHLSCGFPEVLRGLRNLGYAVEAGLFSAAECGAPHRRCRLFFLAHDTNCRLKTMQGQQAGQSSFGGSCQKMADSGNDGLSLYELRRASRREGNEQIAIESFYISHWPAEPGQPQYEWEEPRTICNPDIDGQKRNGGRTEKKPVKGLKVPDKASESRLGRATYGPSCRLDRLRLLGNGVVPQQAEKAFRELLKNFDADYADYAGKLRRKKC